NSLDLSLPSGTRPKRAAAVKSTQETARMAQASLAASTKGKRAASTSVSTSESPLKKAKAGDVKGKGKAKAEPSSSQPIPPPPTTLPPPVRAPQWRPTTDPGRANRNRFGTPSTYLSFRN
ncbi:hypothetical protein JCM5353_000425, partial [Sporobolomyces roseus]